MTSDNLIYILSDEIDYSKLITIGVSGPSVPTGVNLKFDYFSNLNLHKEKIKLIDPRINENECLQVQELIQKNKNSLFAFFLVDPFKERRENYFYKTMFNILQKKNVVFISRYQPRELALEIYKKVGDDRFHVMPYPYLSYREVFNEVHRRKHRIILSGNTSNEKIYPYRKFFWKKSTRSLIRLVVENLPHAGYWEIGQVKKHEVVKDSYINLLSEYKFMFLSPSRCDLEFLKYSECAYAGCVPVGKPASSLTPEMKKAFFEIDFKKTTLSTLKILLTGNDEITQRAKAYRDSFKKDRNPDQLSFELIEFISAYKL